MGWATESGIAWVKETEESIQRIPLTNFTARIAGDVAMDDGADTRRVFEIETQLRGRIKTIQVPASNFSAMNWHTEHLGAGAILHPGFGIKDRARAAIQFLSTEIQERCVYTHTGWRQIDEVRVPESVRR